MEKITAILKNLTKKQIVISSLLVNGFLVWTIIVLYNQTQREQTILPPIDNVYTIPQSFPVPNNPEEQPINSQGQTKITEIRKKPEETMDYEVANFLYEFYKNIRNKDYVPAYKVSNLDRSYKDFVNLYKDIEFVLNGQIFQESETIFEVWVGLQGYGSVMNVYKVKMEIVADKYDNLYIKSANSQQYTAPFEVNCDEMSYCKIYKDGELLYLPSHHMIQDGFGFEKGKQTPDATFFYQWGGPAAKVQGIAIEYSNTNKSLKILGEYEFWAATAAIKDLFQPDLSDCFYNSNDRVTDINFYLYDPCAQEYKDEEWFKKQVAGLELINYRE